MFLDPSVRYVLHFEDGQAAAEAAGLDGEGDEQRPNGARPVSAKKARSTRPKTRSEREASGEPGLMAVPRSQPAVLQPPASVPVLPQAKLAAPDLPAAAAAASAAPADSGGKPAVDAGKQPAGAQVVSLDAFRKK